jgi:hypothetical protein
MCVCLIYITCLFCSLLRIHNNISHRDGLVILTHTDGFNGTVTFIVDVDRLMMRVRYLAGRLWPGRKDGSNHNYVIKFFKKHRP